VGEWVGGWERAEGEDANDNMQEDARTRKISTRIFPFLPMIRVPTSPYVVMSLCVCMRVWGREIHCWWEQDGTGRAPIHIGLASILRVGE